MFPGCQERAADGEGSFLRRHGPARPYGIHTSRTGDGADMARQPGRAMHALDFRHLCRDRWPGRALRDAPISGTIHDFQKTSFGIKWLEESQCIYAWTITTH